MNKDPGWKKIENLTIRGGGRLFGTREYIKSSTCPAKIIWPKLKALNSTANIGLNSIRNCFITFPLYIKVRNQIIQNLWVQASWKRLVNDSTWSNCWSSPSFSFAFAFLVLALWLPASMTANCLRFVLMHVHGQGEKII